MIIEFKVANYRSINEEQALSFVADRATRHPDNLIKRPGYRLLKAIGLFGANASGKSNMVKAIGAMATFVRDSATKMNDGDPILAAEPYRLDPETRDKPSRFEITFVTDGTVYTYGFAADSKRVHEEWLRAKLEKTEKEIFWLERTYNAEKDSYSGLSSESKGLMAELILKWTRSNALVLSVGAQHNIEELLPVYRYLREHIQNYDMTRSTEILKRNTAGLCEDDAELQEQLVALLRDADTGIEELHIKHDEPFIPSQVAFIAGAKAEDFRQALLRQAYLYDHQQITVSRRGTDGQAVNFDFHQDESSGTQRLFALAGPLLNALKTGVMVIVDEIGTSMHPLLTRKLLELFQSPEANPNGAQLLFTTHDPSLLDQDLFRRDQIWLAEKCDGASTFFSLADIQPPIRNTEAFLGNYLTGRYGGTPHLGPAFDMVKTGSKA